MTAPLKHGACFAGPAVSTLSECAVTLHCLLLKSRVGRGKKNCTLSAAARPVCSPCRRRCTPQPRMRVPYVCMLLCTAQASRDQRSLFNCSGGAASSGAHLYPATKFAVRPAYTQDLNPPRAHQASRALHRACDHLHRPPLCERARATAPPSQPRATPTHSVLFTPSQLLSTVRDARECVGDDDTAPMQLLRQP